jgi:hypothetical protein
MSMIKVVDPRGWNWDRPIVQRVKVSSRGLRGADRSDFLKTASHEFADVIDRTKVAKDEEPVHLIALGASEAYGPNRNGDGFKEATCKKYHGTFKKYARWYRNHNNKDKAKSYGYIKASAYNDPMRRVELLAMLNKTKEAADRNGGLVADQEMEKISQGDDIPVSMACRVPHDVCSGCGNRARTREEYCTGSTCKYGGCKDNLTKVARDGHILHVDNPTPTWFDMSKVYRPADRIAYGGGCSGYWDKAASAEDFMPGAELAGALGVTAPLNVILSQDQPHHWSMAVEGQVKLAYGLAELEQKGHGQNRETMRAFTAAVQPELTHDMISILGVPGTEKSAEALGALAEKKIVLPLRDFARWMGKSAMAEQAEVLLPRIFGHLVEQGRLEGQLMNNRFAISEKTASLVQRTLAGNLRENFGLSTDAIGLRAMRSSSRMIQAPNPKSTFWNEKTAADSPEAAALAEEYALYKLAALHKIAATDQEFHLTGRLALAQNCV